MINFHGEIPASKSILNRLLILQSFAPLQVNGDSVADDVVKMKSALASFQRNEVMDCGAAGTTLRFLALRVARKPGEHRLRGSERLMARPQAEIINLLSQLGCSADISGRDLVIRGQGWQLLPSGVLIDRSISSQFASSLFLSAWDLPTPLLVRFSENAVSTGYLQMTLELVRRAGLKFETRNAREIWIAPHSKVTATQMDAEPDLSSAFAVAALAVASGGRAEFTRWPQASLQPDVRFASILEQMGARVSRGSSLLVESGSLRAIDLSLENEPDLFPVLSVLCALAEGVSHLTGAPHLAHKESSRIAKSAEILTLMNAKFESHSDGMTIFGGARPSSAKAVYDPEHDHRLAMAAAVARAAGFAIEILRPEVVNKSFPEFWTIARGQR